MVFEGKLACTFLLCLYKNAPHNVGGDISTQSLNWCLLLYVSDREHSATSVKTSWDSVGDFLQPSVQDSDGSVRSSDCVHSPHEPCSAKSMRPVIQEKWVTRYKVITVYKNSSVCNSWD